jgi:hypothetical protein
VIPTLIRRFLQDKKRKRKEKKAAKVAKLTNGNAKAHQPNDAKSPKPDANNPKPITTSLKSTVANGAQRRGLQASVEEADDE